MFLISLKILGASSRSLPSHRYCIVNLCCINARACATLSGLGPWRIDHFSVHKEANIDPWNVCLLPMKGYSYFEAPSLDV